MCQTYFVPIELKLSLSLEINLKKILQSLRVAIIIHLQVYIENLNGEMKNTMPHGRYDWLELNFIAHVRKKNLQLIIW